MKQRNPGVKGQPKDLSWLFPPPEARNKLFIRNQKSDQSAYAMELAFIRGLDKFSETKSRSQETKARHIVPVPTYRLKNKEERVALGRLKVRPSARSLQKQFDRVVLAYLALIEKTVSEQPSKHRALPISDLVKRLKNQAKELRRLADELVKPLGIEHGVLLPILPITPARQMRLFAEKLEAIVSQLQVLRKRKRRRNAAETYLILKLVARIQKSTGAQHWGEIAVLLKGATHDSGYNNHRLQSLYSSQSQKQKSSGRGMVGAFRYSSNFSD